jgi:predicted enzyme related to lactoylglutathione lyase
MKLRAAKVYVRDIEEASRFYGELVGIPLKAGGPDKGFCIYDTGPTQLIVQPVHDGSPEHEQSLVGRFTGLSFITEDIQSKHRELRARGVQFSAAPEQQFWGGWTATLQDSEGNVFQLVQQ